MSSKEPENIDNKLNEAVLQATEEVFESIFKTKLISGKPMVKKIGLPQYRVNVIISFVGDITGTLTLKVTESFSEVIAKKLLGMDKLDKEMVYDAIGEFVNMVIGSAKTLYSNDRESLKISLPTTIIGNKYIVHTKAARSSKVSLLNFIHDTESFCFELFIL